MIRSVIHMLELVFGIIFAVGVLLLSSLMFYALFEIAKPIIKILLAILFIPFFIYDSRRKEKGTYNEFEDVFVRKS